MALDDELEVDEPEPLPFPARHWLGAALLDAGRHADAERVYREDLAQHPHNGWALLGLQLALKGQGKPTADVDADCRRAGAARIPGVALLASRRARNKSTPNLQLPIPKALRSNKWRKRPYAADSLRLSPRWCEPGNLGVGSWRLSCLQAFVLARPEPRLREGPKRSTTRLPAGRRRDEGAPDQDRTVRDGDVCRFATAGGGLLSRARERRARRC